jgi:uncharacterized protein (DUF58 family)
VKSPSSRTYILPTGYGFSFAAVCIFLLAVAFASTNNAVYLLCFVMSSLAVQSLVITNKNIEKLDVTHLEVADFFADELGYAKVSVQNTLLNDIENIQYEFDKKKPTNVSRMRPGERQQVQVALGLATSAAGRQTCPKLRISSDFPFFFARSWKTYQSDIQFYVYPARKGLSPFSASAYLLHDADAQTQDEFKGHRDYRDNDSPRSIDWKVTSRLQKITVKEYDSEGTKKIWLRWQDTPVGSDSDRKSQLSLWIDLADKKDFEFGLILPSRTIDFGKGPNHKTLCLRALV